MIELMNENQRLFAELIRRYDEMTARLAAAEKVVEAVTVLIGANWNDADGRGRGERDAVVAALTGYRKAYFVAPVITREDVDGLLQATGHDPADPMSHRRDSSDPNRLTDETDDLDAYIERRRKRTDLNSDDPPTGNILGKTWHSAKQEGR